MRLGGIDPRMLVGGPSTGSHPALCTGFDGKVEHPAVEFTAVGIIVSSIANPGVVDFFPRIARRTIDYRTAVISPERACHVSYPSKMISM